MIDREAIVAEIMERERQSMHARTIKYADSAFLDGDALVIVTYEYTDGFDDITWTTSRGAVYEINGKGEITPSVGFVYGKERNR